MKKALHIFDLDGTLTFTPTFASFLSVDKNNVVDTEVGDYLKYFKKIKAAFWDKLAKNVIFKVEGDYVVVINADTGKPFNSTALNYFAENKWKRVFDVKSNMIVIQPSGGFFTDPNTIGRIINQELFNDYENAQNKMILTGRDEMLRDDVEKNLKMLGFKAPNYGLYMYPRNISVREFKTKVILKSIEDNGWDEIHFYEDRPDWLSYAGEVIEQRYPKVKFIPHLITSEEE